MEQAALINSNIVTVPGADSLHVPDIASNNATITDYLNACDGDDNDIGELGETDVGCDFGDFGF